MGDDGIEWELEDLDGGVLYDGADPDMFAGQWERGFHRPLSAAERPTRACGSPGSDC